LKLMLEVVSSSKVTSYIGLRRIQVPIKEMLTLYTLLRVTALLNTTQAIGLTDLTQMNAKEESSERWTLLSMNDICLIKIKRNS